MIVLLHTVLSIIFLPQVQPTAQSQPPSHAQLDQRGEEACAALSLDTPFNHVPVTEWVDWLAKRAPSPKDDYETQEQFSSRYFGAWQAIKAEAQVPIISFDVRIDRSNSTYDPETQQLRLNNARRALQCAGGTEKCLYLKTNTEGQALFFAFYGIDDPYPSAFEMEPAVARRLREEDNRQELTVFFAATPVDPYRTTSTRGVETDRVYHIGVYCSFYHW